MSARGRQGVRDKAARLREQQMRADLGEVLALDAGRRLVWWLLERCHIHRSTYTGNALGSFLEGERNVGLQLQAAIMDVDRDAMFTMMREHWTSDAPVPLQDADEE